MCFKSGVGMISSFRVGWGVGRRYWFEIIILLSVGVFLFLFVGLWMVVVG